MICDHCPHKHGFTHENDCNAPECMGWNIDYNPKPIPIRSHDYDFWHDDYDGADGGNGLCGSASSYEDAMDQIHEIMLEREAG